MNIDFNTHPIELQEIISILGEPLRKNGDNYEWRCPACIGGDTHGNNLKFSESKHILKCFACDFGAEVTSIIARRRYEAQKGSGEATQLPPTFNYQPKEVEEKPKEKEIAEDKLENYYWNCMIDLMKRKDVMRAMFEKHTILPKTAIDCNIGYDPNKDMLVFPSRAIGTDPTKSHISDLIPNGAEYREYTGDKKVRRISSYEPKICCVYGGDFTMEAIICEGYKDAYNLLQILKITDLERLGYTAIFTVQNGTGSINTNQCLQKSNWNRFDNVYLLMDNDSAGDKAIQTAKELFPNMIDYRKEFLGCYGDIQEKFKKEFSNLIDIDKALSSSWIEEWQQEKYIEV